MGWYVTCRICGLENKYSIGCDCYAKQARVLMIKRIGCRILDSVYVDNSLWCWIYEKLEYPDGSIWYLAINTESPGDNGKVYETVYEMTENDFIEMKNPKLQEDTDNENYNDPSRVKSNCESQQKTDPRRSMSPPKKRN